MSLDILFRSNIPRWISICILILACQGCNGDGNGDGSDVEQKTEIKKMVKMDGVKDFWVGSRAYPPNRKVSIDAFLISPCETTQGLYEAVMGDNPSIGDPDPSRPVQNVTWIDAVKFCNRLSRRMGLEACYDASSSFDCDFSKNGFRLPLSSEWEYACRGDTTTPYFWGTRQDDKYCVPPLTSNKLKKLGNKLLHSFAEQVMSKEANHFGLYDMAGNVAEWCQDPVDDNPEYRVYRGGSWENHGWEAFKSKWRSGMRRNEAIPMVGFRIVRKP